jgi:hypothetical protein
MECWHSNEISFVLENKTFLRLRNKRYATFYGVQVPADMIRNHLSFIRQRDLMAHRALQARLATVVRPAPPLDPR